MASWALCWTRGEAAASEALLVPGARGPQADLPLLRPGRPCCLGKPQGRFGDTLWGSGSPAQSDIWRL